MYGRRNASRFKSEILLWGKQKMKKILNEPVAYVDEMLEGLCAAHPEYFRRSGPHGRLISRATGAVPGKVGIVSGGGSGHLPVFTGFVGRGLLDTCAIGEVFSSPSVDQMAEAIRVANGGAGVLRLYGHYGGDNMNFDIAGEIVEMEGIETTTVRVADDVASASLEKRSKRRGVAGLLYAFKMAGAKAESMAGLQEVTQSLKRRRIRVGQWALRSHPAQCQRSGSPRLNSVTKRWKSAWVFMGSLVSAGGP